MYAWPAVPAVSVLPCTGPMTIVGAARNAGIPPESTGAERDAVLAAIHDVDGNLIRDEGGAVKRGP